jgi:hypothetical protein
VSPDLPNQIAATTLDRPVSFSAQWSANRPTPAVFSRNLQRLIWPNCGSANKEAQHSPGLFSFIVRRTLLHSDRLYLLRSHHNYQFGSRSGVEVILWMLRSAP